MAKVAAKNCLKAGGTSLAFFEVLKGFLERFKCVKAVVHPLTRAGNRSSKGVSVLDKSNMARTLGWAKNEHSIGDSERKRTSMNKIQQVWARIHKFGQELTSQERTRQELTS